MHKIRKNNMKLLKQTLLRNRKNKLLNFSTQAFVNNTNNEFNSNASPSDIPTAIYTWGTNNKNCLPNSYLTGTTANDNKLYDFPQPLNVSSLLPASSFITQFECGHNNSGIVLSNGQCYIVGDNSNHQLNPSNDKTINNFLLCAESELAEIGIKTLRLGYSFSAAIDLYGDLHTFGDNGSALTGYGMLGHGDAESQPKPTRVMSLVEDGCLVEDVQVGAHHMTVLTTEREVLTCGSGAYGRLGNLDNGADQFYCEPVEMLQNQDIIQIASGHSFTLALNSEGIVYAWGRNDKGQLGVGGGMMVDMYAMENLPRPINEVGNQLENRIVTKIAAGNNHSACLTENGELFMWGNGIYLEPFAFNQSGLRFVDVVCGDGYTISLTEDGYLFSFGKGKAGVLGHANTKTVNSPEFVEGLKDFKVLEMSAGSSHFACLVQHREESTDSSENQEV